jgi:hypothetical protein
MHFRIAFSGCSATGKSTLAGHFAEALNLPINPVGARSVAAELGFSSPYDVDKAGQRAHFQQLLLMKKLQWEASHESFITDRTPLDNLTYTALHDVHSITESQLAATRLGMKRYTHVFFCPMSAVFNPGDDAARVKERTYHELYEVMLRGLLAQVAHVIYVWESDSNRRIALVRRVLDASG